MAFRADLSLRLSDFLIVVWSVSRSLAMLMRSTWARSSSILRLAGTHVHPTSFRVSSVRLVKIQGPTSILRKVASNISLIFYHHQDNASHRSPPGGLRIMSPRRHHCIKAIATTARYDPKPNFIFQVAIS